MIFSVIALLVLASCASLPRQPAPSKFSPGAWDGQARVLTAYGQLEGGPDRSSTLSWKGIPYAAPPMGDLRWRAPRQPEPWLGVREAKRYGPKAAQRSYVADMVGGSEDCLYLNVWRPASLETGLPVYVWIHGGGNTSGASNAAPEYEGSSLASKANLVFVSVNYRLDLLGWFSHPALKTGDPETDSGNFGTLDLIEALRWVRENIASFGGDPGNVTIAGESAGALNVLTLLIAPKARGLFHKAIAESGYTQSAKIAPDDFSQNLALRLAIEEGKARNEDEAKAFLASLGKAGVAAWLRAASPRDLLRLSASPDHSILSLPYPIFDGAVLPADGFAALADPTRRADVPLIIGTNKEETKLFLMLARQNSRSALYRQIARVTSDVWKAEGADAIADAFDARSAARKVFLYRFDWGAPDGKGKSVMGGRAGEILGAAHGVEISFFLQTSSVFGNALPLRVFTRANQKGRLDLQAKIGGALWNFVRTGDPNAAAGGEAAGGMALAAPLWPAWDSREESPSFLVLDATLDAATIHIERGRLKRASILAKFYESTTAGTREKLEEFSKRLE